jgi:hypothetical protein
LVIAQRERFNSILICLSRVFKHVVNSRVI